MGNETYFEFDANGNTTLQVDARENPTYFYYDPLNRQKGIIDALGNETYFEFDANGNTIAQIDALEHSTYFYYDPLNRQKGIIDALGNETYFEFDANGNTTLQVDARENPTYFYYSPLNRLKGIINALGNETYFEFDANRNTIAQIDALEHPTYFYYDKLNRQKGAINALGYETYYEYDAVGNRTAVVDALEQPTYFYYDKLHRIERVVDALENETTFGYDEVGNQTTVVDALGQATYFCYDRLHRQKSVIDVLGYETYYEYDAVGNLTQIVDALEQPTYFYYDRLNRQKGMIDALGNETYYEYDPVGNLHSTVDPSGFATYFTYDKVYRQTGIHYPDDTNTYYSYDQVGNLISMIDSHGETEFGYDELDRLIHEVQPGGTIATYFVYDEVGQRIRVNSSAGISYFSYDSIGRITSAGNDAPETTGYTYYEYNKVDNTTKKILGNGCFSYYTYDKDNRVTAILNCLPDGSPLVYFHYDYDRLGRITKTRREDGTTIYYGYDQASRLTSEDWYDSGMVSIYAFEWRYDQVGNRTYQKFNGEEKAYLYNEANQLVQVGSPFGYGEQFWDTSTYGEAGAGPDYLEYYHYDTRGNCTAIDESDGSTYFRYNHADLVTSIKYKNGVANYFFYDGKLRRYAIQDSDGLAYFTWGACGCKLLVERDSRGSVTACYSHGYSPVNGVGTMTAARKDVGRDTYYQYPAYDHRGTVYKLTDENGSVVADYEYNSWGEPLYESEAYSSVGNRWRYSTNWINLKDSGGKLVLSPSRLYLTSCARFIQKDPLPVIAMRGKMGIYNNSSFAINISNILQKIYNLNLYNVFKDSPLNYVDPLGLDSTVVILEGSAGNDCDAVKWYTENRGEFQIGGLIHLLKQLEMDYTFFSDIQSDIEEWGWRYPKLGAELKKFHDQCPSKCLRFEDVKDTIKKAYERYKAVTIVMKGHGSMLGKTGSIGLGKGVVAYGKYGERRLADWFFLGSERKLNVFIESCYAARCVAFETKKGKIASYWETSSVSELFVSSGPKIGTYGALTGSGLLLKALADAKISPKTQEDWSKIFSQLMNNVGDMEVRDQYTPMHLFKQGKFVLPLYAANPYWGKEIGSFKGMETDSFESGILKSPLGTPQLPSTPIY